MGGMKLQLLVRGNREIASAEFGEQIEREIAPRLLAHAEGAVKLTVTDLDPPRGGVIPFRRERAALFSLWTSSSVTPRKRRVRRTRAR